MGSFDGAECCELVGLFILNKLCDIIKQTDVGLYRDDGLAVLAGSGPQVEQVRKKVFKLFKDVGLKVTIECNITSTEFLDAYFNLKDSTFRPFKKPNTDLCYVNANSNHPAKIKKEIPNMICDRISKLSSSRDIFDAEKIPFQQALNSAGYNIHNLNFNVRQPQQPTSRCRKRKVIWFNPPFCQTVKTNVAKKFLFLVDKHFKNTPLQKYFDHSTVKVSYCCMPNIKAIIAGHNKFLLNPVTDASQPDRLCNCRGGQQMCPVEGQCLKSSLIYKADIVNTPEPVSYIGLTGNTFKERYTGHKSSFNHENLEHRTSLSAHVWNLKRNMINYDIRWSILQHAPTYNPNSRSCKLCNLEKVKIVYSNDKSLLNKRNEINSKCRHRDKYLLTEFLDDENS